MVAGLPKRLDLLPVRLDLALARLDAFFMTKLPNDSVLHPKPFVFASTRQARSLLEHSDLLSTPMSRLGTAEALNRRWVRLEALGVYCFGVGCSTIVTT
jgi:hypothetical protein